MADLTGGLGADCWAFSKRASEVWYNERDKVLLEAVRRNFSSLGVGNVSFSHYDVSAGSRDWLEALDEFRPDAVYLDPARRDSAGRKVFLLEDCSPDVVALMPYLLKIAPVVIVKVSPMADITMLCRRLCEWLSEIHVVGADGECKELLCLCRAALAFAGTEGPATSILAAAPLRLSNAGPSSPSHANKRSAVSKIVLAEDGFVYEAASASVSPEPSSELLFVPSAAMVKSGLGPGISILPYDEHLSHFGKYWQIIENLPFASSVLKEVGRRYPQAEVTARGVPMSSEELRSRLRVRPGGSVHIFACPLSGSRRLLICKEF